MRFGPFARTQRGRQLDSGVWLASDTYLMGYERGVLNLGGTIPKQDPAITVKVISNSFDKVRTVLMVNEFVLNPYLDFQVGTGAAQTATQIAGALRLRGFRAQSSGAEVQVRPKDPGGELTIQAPYNWEAPCLSVQPERVESPPGPPIQEVFTR